MPVLVLGMHRSGTSVLTRLVSMLGFEVGDEPDLMGPTASNPAGHWEVTRLSELNDALLDHLGGRWSGPPAIDATAQAGLVDGAWGARARASLDETFDGQAWVWKDPRLCVLLPFWRAVLGGEGLAVVLAVRDPGEVARSLAARDGFGTAYGVALWERYQRSVLEGIRGLPTCVVAYPELVEDPLRVVTVLQRGLPGAGPVPPASAVRQVVDVRLRHHVAEDGTPVPPSVDRLVEITDARLGTHASFAAVDLPAETPALQVAFDEHTRLAPYHDLWRRSQARAEEALARREEVAFLRHELDRIEGALPIRAWRRLRRRPRPVVPETACADE